MTVVTGDVLHEVELCVVNLRSLASIDTVETTNRLNAVMVETTVPIVLVLIGVGERSLLRAVLLGSSSRRITARFRYDV